MRTTGARTIIDVSRPIFTGMAIYPRNPPVEIAPARSIARGDSSNVSALALGSHTGTHVDAPLHMAEGAAGVDELRLEALIGPAVVVAIADDVRAIGAREVAAAGLDGHTRVLFRTRNSARFAASGRFEEDFTYLSPEGAAALVERRVIAVGIDALSVEQYHAGHHRAHDTLLQNGVAVIEGLDLAQVGPGEYELLCLPLRIRHGDGAPARVVLMR
ncbi:MAG TPA: cyclase family protein [Gemmatimonadaceae bacterium]|nr:cyclase family protein [Gemmatimonadaceae bacterium]